MITFILASVMNRNNSHHSGHCQIPTTGDGCSLFSLVGFLMMKKIKLNKGLFTLVDDEDFEQLNKCKWWAFKHKYGFYAYTMHYVDGKRIHLHMHRYLMKTPKGMFTDHKDCNGLNNQKDNLRICTHAENNRNKRSRQGSSSKFLGVTRRSNNKYEAAIGRKYLGRFNSEKEAAIIYNIAARKQYGEFANPNKF